MTEFDAAVFYNKGIDEKTADKEVFMTEDEKKELYDWYKKVEDYDPDVEEVDAKYSDDFKERIKKI